MYNSYIITFANQKGGVGKSTLCVLFANYLVGKGCPVRIVDCDGQQSIMERRESDIKVYADKDVQPPYDIISFDITRHDSIPRLIKGLRVAGGVTLIDTPGFLRQQGMVGLIAYSDFIICPFHYDRVTLPSTAEFIGVIEELRSNVGNGMTTRIMFIPNRQNPSAGTKEEKLLWQKAEETFSNYGVVTPRISLRVDMERFSTMSNLDQQLKIVQPAFDRIYETLFGTLEPFK